MTSILSSLFEMPAKIVEAGLSCANSAIGTGQPGFLKLSRDSLFPKPSSVIETGLLTMNAVLKIAQSSVDKLTGQRQRQPLKGAPLDGPQDIDTAVSGFVNRLARLVRFRSWDTTDMGEDFLDVAPSARGSFAYLNLHVTDTLV